MATETRPDNTTHEPKTRGGRRRARILSAFHDCITLRDVAKAADMSASHLLYYYAGKDILLERYFANVSERIVGRIESFRSASPEQQIGLLADLFFAGKGITLSEIGFMLECFGVAVHDSELQSDKTKLDRFCKQYLRDLFKQTPRGSKRARDYAELSYAILIGLRTAAYFDERLGLPRARKLFYSEMMNLAGYGRGSGSGQ